jgi:hypothetical protein
MRKLLHRFAPCLISGFFLALGALIALGLFRDLVQTSAPAFIDHPAGFAFIDHRRVKNQPRFTVKGIIRNRGDMAWEKVKIVLRIYAGDAYMTWCRGGVDDMPARGEKHFQVVCKDTSGSGIPDNVTYDLFVIEALAATR